jgi:hypothetical protein
LESFYSLGLAQKIPCISRVIASNLSTAHLRRGGIFALLGPIFSEALDYTGSSVEPYTAGFMPLFELEFLALDASEVTKVHPHSTFWSQAGERDHFDKRANARLVLHNRI